MQEPCLHLTAFQQIQYYNRKSIWRQVYALRNNLNGCTLWGLYIWLGGGTEHGKSTKLSCGSGQKYSNL